MLNYETEYEKVETYKKIMIQVISEYTDSVKNKLLLQMLQQRNLINEHEKEIKSKISDIGNVMNGAYSVEKRLKQIVKNEEVYL